VTTTMRQILIAAAMSMTWAGDASAFNGTVAMTGADLFQKCRPINMADETLSHAQFSDLSECMGYIVGVIQGYSLGADEAVPFRTEPKNRICTHPDVTFGDLTRVVLADLAGMNKSMLDMPAVILVRSTIMRVYPCPTTPNSKDGGR
jgi:hypothetical protein